MTTVYAIILLTALSGLCSLGVDYGRVQLAKIELRRTADSAARAAASAISSGVTAVQNLAVAYGTYNTADGTAVTIDPNNDVEFGTWDATAKTFTVLTGAARTDANAIRITARRTAATGNAIPLTFGRLVGKNDCDVRASAIALFIPSSSSGFVGLNKIDLGNGADVYSYNSNSGPPGGANLLSSAQLISNTQITLGNDNTVNGNIIKGPAATLTTGSNFYLSGSQYTIGSNLSYAATENPTVGSFGSVTLGNNQNLTLPGGTYNYSSVTLGSGCTINFLGAVTIYLTGDFNCGSNFVLNAYQNKPSNLKLRLVGDHDFNAGSGLNMTADIYGPSWDVITADGASLKGSLVVKSLTNGINSSLYYDTSLAPITGSGGSVATVK